MSENLSDRDIDEFSKKLSDDQRRNLLFKLIDKEQVSPIIIIGGCNSIHSTGVLQLNGDPEKIAEQLLQSNPELISALLKALGIYVQSKEDLSDRHNERSESS